MSDSGVPEQVSDRVFCPNCPADYPPPFSSRQITCRRCETEFLAPDDARTSRTDAVTERSDAVAERDAEAKSPSLPRVFIDQFPNIALGLNTLSALLWVAGIVSFEVAAMTILVITSAIVTERR